MTTTLKDATAKDLSKLFNAQNLAHALYWAAAKGQKETVRFLLDRGVDPDALYHPPENFRPWLSPLSVSKNPAVVRLLVERGAKNGLPEALRNASNRSCTDTVLFLLDRAGETFSVEELRIARYASFSRQDPDIIQLLEWQLEHNKANAAPVAPSPGPTAP